MDANTRNWVIGGVIAIVVIVLGWWLLTKPPHGKSSMATSTAASTETTVDTSSTTGATTGATVTTEASGETLSVADQAAGSSVSVTGVSASKTVWVAVRDALRVYGARRVESGAQNASVTVPLLKPTVAGKSYQVVMYVDDGDNAFDMHKDALVTGVGSSFSAQ